MGPLGALVPEAWPDFLAPAPDEGALPWRLVLWAAVLGAALFLAYRLNVLSSFQRYVYDKRGKRLPGPVNPWPFGFIWKIKEYRDRSVWWLESRKLFETHGPLIGLRVFRGYTILVADPDMARVLVTGSADAFPKGALYKNLQLLEGGLVVSNNPVWRQDRRLLNPCFTREAVAAMHPVFLRHARRLVQHIRHCCWYQGQQQEEGAVVDLSGLCTAMAFDVICESGFGHTTNSIGATGHEDEQQGGEEDDNVTWAINDALREIVRRLTDPVKVLQYLPWRFRRARRAIDTLLRLVERLMSELERGERKAGSRLVDLMLAAATQHGGQEGEAAMWSTEKMLAQCITFLIAGHETVGAMLAWTVLELGEHPEVLAKLRAELDQALGQPGGGEEEEEGRRLLELVEGGSSLPYLECVMKESLRLHPPVTVFSRGTTRDVEVGGYLLPAGYHVGVSVYALHTNKAVWGETADQFWPERWQQPEPCPPSPWAYMPFSMGPRNCIGQRFALSEASIALAVLLRAVDFELLDRKAELVAIESLTVKPARLRCRVRMRERPDTGKQQQKEEEGGRRSPGQ